MFGNSLKFNPVGEYACSDKTRLLGWEERRFRKGRAAAWQQIKQNNMFTKHVLLYAVPMLVTSS
jgi:hypothetical protein